MLIVSISPDRIQRPLTHAGWTDADTVIDLRDQPVLVAFDVEHGAFIHGVSVRECPSHIHQILPRRLLRNSEPRIQRRLQPGMPRRCLFEPFTADYVHSSLEGKVRKLRTYSSQTANCQGGRQKGGLMLALYPLLVSG